MFSEARLYSESSGPQQRKAFQMLLDYYPWLKWTENEAVLDIGSGPGNITEQLLLPFLPDSIKHLVGVDKSEAMVEYATKSCTDARLRFYKMDITDKDNVGLVADLPSEIVRNGFDKVFCFYLLHWMADMLPQALQNIQRLMNHGAQGLSIQYTRIPVYDVYVDIGESDKWAPHLKGVTLEYNPLRTAKDPHQFMISEMAKAGLNVDQIHSYSSHNVYENRSQLRDIMTSIDPFLQYLPLSLREEYMNDFLDMLIERTDTNDDGFICVPFTIMTCAFSKS